MLEEDDMSKPAQPQIRAFFDEPTNTVSYLVWDPATRDGAVIDPVTSTIAAGRPRWHPPTRC
jgi:hypothetical protein